MKQKLTPNYDHEKLDNPSLADLIDVFEDAWKGYILVPTRVLLNTPHGDIAAMTLLCPYFESIEALHRGESSVNKSQEFFIDGFLRVFEKILGTVDEQAVKHAAKANRYCDRVARTPEPCSANCVSISNLASSPKTLRLSPDLSEGLLLMTFPSRTAPTKRPVPEGLGCQIASYLDKRSAPDTSPTGGPAQVGLLTGTVSQSCSCNLECQCAQEPTERTAACHLRQLRNDNPRHTRASLDRKDRLLGSEPRKRALSMSAYSE